MNREMPKKRPKTQAHSHWGNGETQCDTGNPLLF